jgi:hypothetical protein
LLLTLPYKAQSIPRSAGGGLDPCPVFSPFL